MSSNHVHDMHKVQPLMLPIIDLSLLSQTPQTRSLVIKEIRQACQNMGCFHIINHEICESIIEGALDLNSKFFNMPVVNKEELMSDDIYKPVRFGTVRGENQGALFSRDFLKLYAHPLENFLSSWPANPPDYRDKMGMYTKEMKRLAHEIFGAIMESLNLEPTFLKSNLEQGFHIMAVNCYPACSQSNLKMSLPPHTDHTIITILFQSCPGLELMDRVEPSWTAVPELKGSLQVLVGDHLEVISNGLYKSVRHRAVPSLDRTRLSIVSLHSLSMDEIVEPAMKLVDEEHPIRYKGSSLKDFLNHLSSKQERTFIESLKIEM